MTCYFNVIIQSLFHTQEIREHILKLDFEAKNKLYNPKYENILIEFQ